METGTPANPDRDEAPASHAPARDHSSSGGGGNPCPSALPAFLQSSLDGTILFDISRVIIDVNPVGERLLGAQGELLTGTEFLIKPFTTERLLAVVEKNLKARPAAAY